MKLKLRDSDTIQQDVADVTKNTNGDKIRAIRDEIAYLFEINGVKKHAYYEDHDDNYIYFVMWSEQDSNSTYWRISYSYDGIKVTITEEEATQGVMQKQWKDIPQEDNIDKSQLVTLGTLEKFFHKHLTNKQIIKQFDDEQMIAIEPLYSPAGTEDLHGEMMELEEMEKAIESFNRANEAGTLQTSLFHSHKTDGFVINKAWINHEECIMGDSIVPKYQPLVEIQFLNKSLWEKRKSGELQGLSIGAQGYRENDD